MFDNGKIINFIFALIIISAVSSPFIRMSKETFLAGKHKTIKIGSYKVDLSIGLRENKDRTEMEGFSYFEFSDEKLSKANCLLKVSVKIDDYSGSNLNSPISRATGENLSCQSSQESCTYKNEGMGRLSLYFYNAPIKDQTYTFSLISSDGHVNEMCEGSKTITHKIRYRRSSWWERAMSV